MSNQASEDKIIRVDNTIFNIEDYVGGNIEGVDTVDRMGFTVFLRNELEQLIRTEKLKLLAAIRERVVGEDEKPDGFSANRNSKKNLRPMYKNQLRAEQRIVLTKLEAEL